MLCLALFITVDEPERDLCFRLDLLLFLCLPDLCLDLSLDFELEDDDEEEELELEVEELREEELLDLPEL